MPNHPANSTSGTTIEYQSRSITISKASPWLPSSVNRTRRRHFFVRNSFPIILGQRNPDNRSLTCSTGYSRLTTTSYTLTSQISSCIHGFQLDFFASIFESFGQEASNLTTCSPGLVGARVCLRHHIQRKDSFCLKQASKDNASSYSRTRSISRCRPRHYAQYSVTGQQGEREAASERQRPHKKHSSSDRSTS